MIITTGKSRKDTRWKPTEISWPDLVSKLGTVYRTHETMREYRAMSREEQGQVKDIGGFVGGRINGGRRKNDAVVDRCLVTLDADNAQPDTWDDVELTWNGALCCYSTHSHTPDNPRLRFVIPLKRAVSPEEYPAVARKLAARIGIETMDPSTYEAARLMYWPSCPVDAEPVFHVIDGEPIDPDAVLAEYGLGDAWKDTTLWPIAKGEQEVRVKEAKRQGDPTEKPGIIGLFCRAYGIEEAIEELLPGVYEPAGAGRWTYTAGSTAAGAVEYDNKFLYSHHGTDPCGGQLVNSFDLVRIHLFGDRDVGSENQEITRRPSYQAMCDFAAGLDKVKQQRASELGESLDDLAGGVDDTDWVKQLAVNGKTGAIEATLNNFVLIIRNDPALKGIAVNNLLKGGAVMLNRAPWDRRGRDIPPGGLPWADSDDAGLRWYMETRWKLTGRDKINDAVELVREENAIDPVREYLTGLVWDGVERLDTMLVRWMGAEDNDYVRAVTRKWMCGAVRRALHPGCRFECMLVLVGKQGIGKSSFAQTIAKHPEWFTESLGRMDGSKESYEALRGIWIAEVSEMAPARKSEAEEVKKFLSSRDDKYRKAYGKQENQSHPRRCVFYGSTNDMEVLRDPSGARRFWPVAVTGFDHGQLKGLADEVDQLWAEAVEREPKETLWLIEDGIREKAEQIQAENTVQDELVYMIHDYLDEPLPDDWYSRDLYARQQYFDRATGTGDLGHEGRSGSTLRRDKVCILEIMCEMLQKSLSTAALDKEAVRRIRNVMNNLPGWKKQSVRIGDPYPNVVYGWRRETERSD